MTISELITDGCKIIPEKSVGAGFSIGEKGTPTAGCVRAAAHAAYAKKTGKELTFDNMGVCDELYDSGHPLNVALSSIEVQKSQMTDELRERVPDSRVSLLHALTELNDHLRWSREEIAEWVEETGLDASIDEGGSMTNVNI